MSQNDQPHLRVFENRSELHLADGRSLRFVEGTMTLAAKERYSNISSTLHAGFLEREIRLCLEEPDELMLDQLTEAQHEIIESLVSSVTSEVGRAVLGLSFLQLTIKAIEPQQSIRLHKGGKSTKDFSWADGLSMRTLDNTYITPVLRSHNLLKLNADGFMMTRTLAENYPYSRFYKAKIRGARDAWVELVEALEHPDSPMHARAGLQLLISKLLNNAENFNQLADQTVTLVNQMTAPVPLHQVTRLMKQHWVVSTYAARIMEISMHAFMQALQELHVFDYDLEPLSQMRSANKKHGNIGDIELFNNRMIIESWDAKFGKTYLHDELNELADKLDYHPHVQLAGFVTSGEPDMREEIILKIRDLSESHAVDIQILSFDEWVDYQLAQFGLNDDTTGTNQLSEKWLFAYTETLALRRPEQAPIDEPCHQWLESWANILKDAQANEI